MSKWISLFPHEIYLQRVHYGLTRTYDNLSTELNTLGIRLDKNIYQGMQKESLKGFLSDFEKPVY